MSKCHINGLQFFIYSVIDLISRSEKITCDFVNSNLSKGIATQLVQKYPDVFENVRFQNDLLQDVDDYCKGFAGIAENYSGDYLCKQDEGLQLLLKLILNDLLA